jgi:hypothetical protein
VEAFCQGEGIGELQLVLPSLAALTRAGQRIAWLAPPYLPYAPALRAAGVRLDMLTVVRAPGRRDALWAAEQALRAGAFHAFLAWLPQSHFTELRRLAVAAQASPGFALLFRPGQAAGESSPAVLRLALAPVAGQLAVRILKRRGAPVARPLLLPIARPFGRSPMNGASNEPFSEPSHALGRAPLSPTQAAGARARACAA